MQGGKIVTSRRAQLVTGNTFGLAQPVTGNTFGLAQLVTGSNTFGLAQLVTGNNTFGLAQLVTGNTFGFLQNRATQLQQKSRFIFCLKAATYCDTILYIIQKGESERVLSASE